MALQIPITIDRSSPIPLYHQLAQQLTRAIDAGPLQPGDPFENEVALAERLNLSRPTVRRAIAELVGRGLLVRRRGIGTTVASRVIHRRPELTSLHEDLRLNGRVPATRVLKLVRDKRDPRAAEALGLTPETPLLFVQRLRYADDVPLALLRNWLPPIFSDVTAETLARQGLYEVLRDRGVELAVAHQTIGARRPTGAERRQLALGPGDPVLTMIRTAYDANGTAMEFGDHSYRADLHAFDITLYAR